MINRQPGHTGEPLVTRVDLKVGDMFKNRPVPSDDRATVFLDRYGRYHHLTEQIPIGGISGYKALFLVDTSVFSRDFQFKLPSREQAYHFIAKVTVSWRVTDPVEAAKTSLMAADQILKPYVERVLRDVGATFPIEDAAGAEQAMAASFTGHRRRQPFAQGVSVLDCDAALTLDGATMAHLRNVREGQRKHDITTSSLSHQLVEQKEQQRIDMLRSAHELELRTLEQEHELRLKHQQMKFFGGAAAQDPANLIGLILANDPGKATDVIGMLMNQHQGQLDDARKVLDLVLDKGLANRSDVAEITAKAASVITQRMTGSPFKVDVDPSAPVLPQTPSEQAITAEVVPEPPKPNFDPSYFDDDDEDDEDD